MITDFLYKIYLNFKFRTYQKPIYSNFFQHSDKRICIFNPTIYFSGNKPKLLMRYVSIDGKKRQLCQYNLSNLDNNKTIVNVINKELFLISFNKYPWIADPRSHTYKNKNYFTFNTGHSESPNKFLYFDSKNDPYEIYTNFKRRNIEKNWILFEHQKKELAIYSHSPKLDIVKLNLHNKKKYASQYKSFNYNNFFWEKKYGEIRGGAGVFEYNKYYISIFQSSIKTIKGLIYNTGLLVMDKKNLKPMLISKRPILNYTNLSNDLFINENILNKQAYRAVYPTGYINNGNHLYISYGVNDYMFGISLFNINSLMKDMIKLEVHDKYD